MICVLTIVSGAGDQESARQQKSSDIPSAQIYLARPWRIADISGNVAFVILPWLWAMGNIEQLSNLDNILWRRGGREGKKKKKRIRKKRELQRCDGVAICGRRVPRK